MNVLRKRHLGGLVLVITLMTALIPFSAFGYAQNNDKKVEKFLALAEKSMEKVESLMEVVEGQDGDVSEDTSTLYDDGVDLLEQALALEDDPEGTIELAKGAMIKFREAIRQLNELLEEEEPEVEAEEGEEIEVETEEDSETIAEAIERARERIDRVEFIIDANGIYLTDFVVAELSGLLDDASVCLDESEAALALDEPNQSTAAHKLGDANRLISRAFVSMRKAAGAMNSGRINGFLTVIRNFHRRIGHMQEHANQQGSFTTEEYAELQGELGAVSVLFGNAESAESEDNIEEAIAKLIEARMRLESIRERSRRKGRPGS